MSENHLKINRRQFLARAGAGALAAILAPGMLLAAGRNVAPAPAGNPLFTGALGQYDGINIYEDTLSLSAIEDAQRWDEESSPLDDFKFMAGDRWTEAQLDLFTRGQAAVKVNKIKAEWIPINKMIRKG